MVAVGLAPTDLDLTLEQDVEVSGGFPLPEDGLG